MKKEKPVLVTFRDKKLEEEYEQLKKSKYHDWQLYTSIERAISEIKKNPLKGIKIQKKLWPKEYIKKYGITNLWKYNLRGSWRLIYTIKEDEAIILNIILDWFSHKEYEKKFKY